MLESRSFPRADMDLPVSITDAAGNNYSARMLNVSDGGFLLMTLRSLASDALVDVVVTNEQEVHHFPARIIRSREEQAMPAPLYRVAGEWNGLVPSQKSTLQSFIDRNLSIFWDRSNTMLPEQVAIKFIPIVKRLAQSIAMKLPRHVTVDDLVGAGFVALVEHHSKNSRLSPQEFERSALSRIRGAMLDELRLSDPLTRRMRQRERQIEVAQHTLERQLGRTPSHDEVAGYLKLDVVAYRTALRAVAASRSCSLEPHHANYVADASRPDPEESFGRTQSINQLRTAMGALPDRLRRVLELHYGDDLTLREVGNIIGVTEARVCQLVSAAVIRLRDECFGEVAPASGPRAIRSSRPARKDVRKVA